MAKPVLLMRRNDLKQLLSTEYGVSNDQMRGKTVQELRNLLEGVSNGTVPLVAPQNASVVSEKKNARARVRRHPARVGAGKGPYAQGTFSLTLGVP